jgi:hypothetical protein
LPLLFVVIVPPLIFVVAIQLAWNFELALDDQVLNFVSTGLLSPARRRCPLKQTRCG